MGEQRRLLELEQRPANETETAPPTPLDELQLRRPDRRQITYARIDVERLVADDHAVRAIWELTGKLDLSGFAAGLRTRLGPAGRPAWDPRLPAAIWIWAYSEGIASARELERQSHYRPELQWLCGLEIVNPHSLSEFRVKNAAALETIFTQVLALLSQEGLIDLAQVAVDGTRVRACASLDELGAETADDRAASGAGAGSGAATVARSGLRGRRTATASGPVTCGRTAGGARAGRAHAAGVGRDRKGGGGAGGGEAAGVSAKLEETRAGVSAVSGERL